MTAIAIWCNHEIEENPGLWIAADSLVSTSAGSKLINDGAKVFALPIVCRSAGKNGFFTERYYEHTYGYCFAGDTLLGQNAYLSLVPLLSNLFSSTSYIPSSADVARYVHAYLSHTYDDCKAERAENSVFEAALFGHCSITNTLAAYHFFPENENGVFEVTCKLYDNMQEREFLYLGDSKVHMSSQIKAALAAEPTPMAEWEARSKGRRLSRIPRYIIQDHVNDEYFPTIGGSLQLGIADRFGFRAFPLCKPGVNGQAIISYLGRELTQDLQYVGRALVGGEGMG